MAGKVQVQGKNPLTADYVDINVDASGNIGTTIEGGSVQIDVAIGGPGTFVTGTATVTSATVTFSSESNGIEVNNTSTSIVLLASLDGTTWIEIDPESSRSWDIEADDIKLKSASGTVDYEVIYTIPSV